MNQKTRPISPDITVDGWTPTPVYSRINEPIPNDSTFVVSSNNPSGDMFEVKFAPLLWPNLGPQTVTVRIRKTDTGAVPVSILLVQGSTIIAGRNYQVTQSFLSVYTLVLTDLEKSFITDYTNLRLRVVAGNPASVNCCNRPLPFVLKFVATNLTGGWLNPWVIMPPLFYWNGDWWVPSLGPPITAFDTLKCAGDSCSDFVLQHSGNIFANSSITSSCDPLVLRFIDVPAGASPSDGVGTFTFTE